MFAPIAGALDKAVLMLVEELVGVLDLEEFGEAMIRALRGVVPSEWCALHEVPPELPSTISITDPPVPAESHELFAELWSENPIASYFLRTRDGRPTRFSDLVSTRELHALDIYKQIYGPLGVEHQIAFTLPSGAARVLGVALSRREPDYSDHERDVLLGARPYLVQMYRNALSYSARPTGTAEQLPLPALQALGLSRRQAEVLRLTATGHAASDAAAALGISVRTAQKHLEHCYRALGVTSRSEAAKLAWIAASAAAGPSPTTA